MGDVRIRPYRPGDRAAVEAIMREATADVGAYFPELDDEDGDPALNEEYYEGPCGCLLVAIGDNAPIGTVGMRRPGGRLTERHGEFPETVGELKRMHVLPTWQRRGVGTQLLDRISDRAREVGYEEFVFSTTSVQQTAHTFYEERGFERFDREPVSTGEASFELFYYRGPVRGPTESPHLNHQT